MKLFIFVALVLTFNSMAQAEGNATSTDSVSTQSAASDPMHGVLEWSFGTTNQSTLKSASELNLDFKESAPWSLLLGFGGRKDEDRAYLGIGYEKLGEFTNQSGEQQSIRHLFFKISYDRRLGPWLTDWYLNVAANWAPAQGQQIFVNGVSFSPEATIGAEVGIGWLSPIDVAFMLGYKTAYHSYEYYKPNSISGSPSKDFSSVYYSGVFLTTSIGRF